ncbi:putative inner membrane protein [Listeria riparia FSL S10-1204]|uniref:Putative inner membrane protein n=1 Tax=Listeria riparia FSL S10-1204 TaxID=1265816 RepID=W7DCD2_9LIST|nr:putative inner membrane protein [Listeria riparia FSL S10-1204]
MLFAEIAAFFIILFVILFIIDKRRISNGIFLTIGLFFHHFCCGLWIYGLAK